MRTALIQAQEIAKIQRASVLEIRKTLTQFKTVAINRALAGNTSIITQKELDRLTRYLGASMAMADQAGRRRTQILANRVKIKLSGIEDFVGDPYFNGQALRIITDYAQSVNSALELFTRELIGENLPIAAMKKKLADEFARLGVDPRNSYTLENIARTQAQLSYNAAKFDEEQQDYIQEILWGYKYSTVGDVRVRDEHARLEGVTLPKDDPFWQKWYPPNGWSCRCSVIPIFEKENIKRPPKGIVLDEAFAGTPNQLLGKL